MKRIVGLVLFSLLLTQSVEAQQDPKAKAVLEAVSKKIGSLKSLKANFALHLTGANGKIKETKKGSFFMKGQKYRVSMDGQEIICDNKTVWTYMKDVNEVQVSNYNPSEQTLSPAKLFTNFYDQEFTYRYAGQRKVNGKNCDVIEMVPNGGNKQFSRVELAIDKDTHTITGGNIWEKNGTQYQYSISGFSPDANIADTWFTFNEKEHPGVEVVDLR
jgi:outer membrane lipoprotein carrier protein